MKMAYIETTRHIIEEVFDELKEYQTKYILYIKANNSKEHLLISSPLEHSNDLNNTIRHLDGKKILHFDQVL